MKENINAAAFGKRLLDLRKNREWSQPDLAKMIGTSGAIIGRYERGEMTPSIEVARKLAEAFEVTVDSLVSNREIPEILKNQEMVSRWQTLDELSPDDRDRILYVVDGLVRDARARMAYSNVSSRSGAEGPQEGKTAATLARNGGKRRNKKAS